MKKLIFLLLIVFSLQGLSFAQAQIGDETDMIKAKIPKIQAEIKRLEAKLKVTKSPAAKKKITETIKAQNARLDDLKKKLVEIERTKFRKGRRYAVGLLTQEAFGTEEVIAQPEILEKTPDQGNKKEKRWVFEIGAVAGMFSGATAVFGELRFPQRYIFGPATTTLRLAGGLVQSEDMKRRYAPVQLDAVFNLPPGYLTGVDNYLGAGFNYVVLTTGRVPGTFGGQAFYGIEGEGFGGKLFGELGYGILRTGFSPSHSGVTAMVGFRKGWGF